MALCPLAAQRPVPSHGGPMIAHQGLVLHVQVGSGSCYGEFANPGNQASSTWWFSKSGAIEQYVDSDLIAWTEAAGNLTWNSVETEGVPTDPLTDAQIAALAKLYAWGHVQYGWPFQLAEAPGARGFGWHGMGGALWGGHLGCPGDLRKAQRQQILDLAKQSQEDDMPPTFTVTCPTGGYWVVRRADGGVYAYGGAPFAGSMAGKPMNAQVAALGYHRNGASQVDGYWLLGEDGGIFAFGAAPYTDSYAAHPEWQTGKRYMVAVVQHDPGYDIIAIEAGTDPPKPDVYDLSQKR